MTIPIRAKPHKFVRSALADELAPVDVQTDFNGDSDYSPFDDVVNAGEDPENYYPGIRYEFSIAPREQCEYSAADTRYQHMYDAWTVWLATILGGVADWELITECSTPKHGRYLPSQLNRIHFHGYITFTKYGKFIGERAHFLSRHCTYKFSNLREQIWATYIAKQKYCMEPDLGSIYRLSSSPVSSPTAQALRPKESKPTAAKSSVRRAGVYNPEAVIAFN